MKDKENLDELFEEEYEEHNYQIKDPATEEDSIDEEIDPEELEYERILDSLENHCTYTWICMPPITREENGSTKVLVDYQQLHEVDDETFFKWLCYTWPPAKMMKHEPEDYTTLKAKQAAFLSVASYHKLVRFY